MFEEDIFGEDSITLVLRYDNYVIQNFDKKSKIVTFDRLKAILASKEMPCFFSKKDDRRHIISIPVSDDGCKRVRDAAFFLIIMLVTFAATLLKPQKYVSSRTIQKCVEHVSTST